MSYFTVGNSHFRIYCVTPRQRCTVTKPMVVDPFIKDYQKSHFPKHEDGEFAQLQSAMLKMCGPMTYLWSDLIEQDLLHDPNVTISIADVLDIIQWLLVLLEETWMCYYCSCTGPISLAVGGQVAGGKAWVRFSVSSWRVSIWSRVHQTPAK